MLIKRKENNEKTKKIRLLTIVGSLIFLLGVSIYTGKLFYNYISELEDNKQVEQFFEMQEEVVEQEEVVSEEEISEQGPIYNYIGVLEIPKIDVKRGFTSLNDKANNVNKNIQVIEKSDMPNVDNGNLIIAGHSGSGRIAFFKNLYKVSNDDVIYVYYQNVKYTYNIVNIYDVKKTGTVAIKRDKDKTILTLITCRHNTNKQIVVISELINKEDM